jgi:nucleoside 2-deoxyribosyltransferase
MSFHPSLDPGFDLGIKPAVETDCGFTVIRVDRVPHNDNINDRILAGVRTAQFVIADFTLQRQGVYFEAGFAMGLGRPVIWTCRQDDFANVHFDTRQFNHIVWAEPVDLRPKLAARIRATVALPARMAT